MENVQHEQGVPGMESDQQLAQARGRLKTYYSFKYPALTMGSHKRGNRIEFQDCVFRTDNPALQEIIEGARTWNIRDITGLLATVRKLPREARLFLCFSPPDLEVDPRIKFVDGFFATDDDTKIVAITSLPEYKRKEIIDATKTLRALAES